MLELILTNGETGFTFLVSILLNQSEALIHEPMGIEKPSLTISNINNDSRLARPKYKKNEHYPENFERHCENSLNISRIYKYSFIYEGLLRFLNI